MGRAVAAKSGARSMLSLPIAHGYTEAMNPFELHAKNVWVIGGAEIYAQALPYARKAVITEIDLTVEDGDAFAPQFAASWQETRREEHVSSQGLHFRFITLEHKGD